MRETDTRRETRRARLRAVRVTAVRQRKCRNRRARRYAPSAVCNQLCAVHRTHAAPQAARGRERRPASRLPPPTHTNDRALCLPTFSHLLIGNNSPFSSSSLPCSAICKQKIFPYTGRDQGFHTADKYLQKQVVYKKSDDNIQLYALSALRDVTDSVTLFHPRPSNLFLFLPSRLHQPLSSLNSCLFPSLTLYLSQSRSL